MQDEWKATPNLTVTAGIRYNFFNALHAVNHDDVPFDFGTCGGYCPNTASFFHPRYDDFDPRVGIACAHGDTVLRVGAGIYRTDGQEDDQDLPDLELVVAVPLHLTISLLVGLLRPRACKRLNRSAAGKNNSSKRPSQNAAAAFQGRTERPESWVSGERPSNRGSRDCASINTSISSPPKSSNR